MSDSAIPLLSFIIRDLVNCAYGIAVEGELEDLKGKINIEQKKFVESDSLENIDIDLKLLRSLKDQYVKKILINIDHIIERLEIYKTTNKSMSETSERKSVYFHLAKNLYDSIIYEENAAMIEGYYENAENAISYHFAHCAIIWLYVKEICRATDLLHINFDSFMDHLDKVETGHRTAKGGNSKLFLDMIVFMHRNRLKF